MFTYWSRQQRLLCSGFARFECEYLVPNEIIDICQQYLNDNRNWKIKGSKLQKMLNNKRSNKIYDTTFIIKDIEFQCFITTNAFTKHFTFSFHCKSFPNNIESISIYYGFHCSQTNSLWFDEITIKNIDIVRSIWFPYSKLYQFQHIIKSITFVYYVDITSIQLKKDYIQLTNR